MVDQRSSAPGERARDLFDGALERPAEEREAFLAGSCGGDDTLRRRVDQLLSAYLAADDLAFLGDNGTPAHGEATTRIGGAPTREPMESTGSLIGPYRLDALIGEGGFGRVYKAYQEHPVARTVAVKVLKPGMDSGQILARFEAEARALALMDHPGIARILDAGTTENGRPYFVMQYVEGETVTSYCDRRTMEVIDRLELFEKICHAVHHAHQKGVIHRDIKPSNLLVAEHDDVPMPKVIDFGIAKALADPLTDRSLQTGVRQLLGTPQYMSPEQARVGEADIDTRSDIYSLGVVLHELLTGVTPFETLSTIDDPAEFQRVLREELPLRPSQRVRVVDDGRDERAHDRRNDHVSLSRSLRGDIDWIVLKALEKDPARRYDSAAALAGDIRRHIDHEPVQARRPGTGYLTWKFVQRHQVAATLVVGIGIALTAGLVLAVLGLREAGHQRDVAQGQLRDLYVLQARAWREGSTPGRRRASLDALASAAWLGLGDDVRDEAIACMTLSDVTLEREVPLPKIVHSLWPRPHGVVVERQDSGPLRLFDAIRGEAIGVLAGTDDAAPTVLIGAGLRYAALFFPDRRLVVRDIETSEPIVVRSMAASLFDMAFDRGAVPPRWLAVAGGDRVLRVLSLPDGAVRFERDLPAAGRPCLASSPDGARLAIGLDDGDEELLVIDTGSGETLFGLDAPDGVNAIDYSPDGTLIVGGCDDNLVHLWSVAERGIVRSLRGHQSSVVEVAFDPGGEALATYGWDNTTRIWDIRLDEPLVGPLRGHALLAFGERLVTRQGSTAHVFAVQRSPELRRARTRIRNGAPVGVAVTSDGRWMASAGASGVHLWRPQTMERVAVVSEEIARAVHFTHDGRGLVALTLDEVYQWSLREEGGDLVAGEPEVVHAFRNPDSMNVRPGGGLVVIDLDGVHFVDLDPIAVRRVLPWYRGMATVPSVSPDGRWLFTGTWKGEPARVRDVRTGEVVAELGTGHVVGRFSPKGGWLCLTDGTYHRFVETGSWRVVREVPRENFDDLAGPVAFSGDGSVVAVGCSRYVTELIEPDTGRVIARLESPDGIATSALAFDHTGTVLGASSPARDLLLWDLDRIGTGLGELGFEWR